MVQVGLSVLQIQHPLLLGYQSVIRFAPPFARLAVGQSFRNSHGPLLDPGFSFDREAVTFDGDLKHSYAGRKNAKCCRLVRVKCQ